MPRAVSARDKNLLRSIEAKREREQKSLSDRLRANTDLATKVQLLEATPGRRPDHRGDALMRKLPIRINASSVTRQPGALPDN